jgi:tellurite resistance protein TerC
MVESHGVSGIVAPFAFPLVCFMWSEIQSSLPIILSLIVLEGLLSVDNALGIAAMARHLPHRQRALAMRYGIFGAYAFRGLALLFASSFAHLEWVRWLGAGYLIYLLCDHFGEMKADQDAAEAHDPAPPKVRGLFGTIMAINLLDLSLSVDNVLAAVALDKRFWVICTGVFIGILVLRFAAVYCIKLIERHPILEHAAFLLIGYVGLLLILELTYHREIHAWEKFLGVVIIISLCLTYARVFWVQQMFRPFVRAVQWPLWVVYRIIDGLLSALGWLPRLLWRKLRATA